MSYEYKHFISQNVAPKNTKQINVYDKNNNKLFDIPLGRLAQPTKEKLYSFGLLSDIHVVASQSDASTRFDNALSYFESMGCKFCCHSGDMTTIGFWYNRGDTEIYLGQFAEYKRICDLHPTLPVYGICGNHENYNAVITDNLKELEEYTGHSLYYTIRQDDDLFIFIGQPVSYQTINKTELQWLYETLEANRNIRCHIFMHVFMMGDSGNPKDCYPDAVFGEHSNRVQNLLRHYKNTILYHGHSHTKFICQEFDKTANYTTRNGFRSIHVPSVLASRDIVQQEDGTYTKVVDYNSSQGYLVDVYDDCLVFNGIDFMTNKPIPLGTFKIDIELKEIEAGTFKDNTGVIITNT